HAALLSVTMTLRPRSSTLFPYTTLFRSGLGAALAAHGCRSQLAAGGGAGLRVLVRPARPGGPGDRLGHGGDDRPARRGAAGGQLDRKSTRLNSSHVKISYAVFCLKKKTK